MGGVGLIILALIWLALIAWMLAWVVAEDRPAPAPVDPYAQDVARFRKDLADWDRDGRP